MYYMTVAAADGEVEKGYFLRFDHTNWKTSLDIHTPVGRVELVDDPDFPTGHEAKAVKVFFPAEVQAAARHAAARRAAGIDEDPEAVIQALLNMIQL
jgi:hypothetical protein